MTPEEYEQYVIAVAALAKARSGFAGEQEKFAETAKKTRAYKTLEKECLVWKDRIYKLSGRHG